MGRIKDMYKSNIIIFSEIIWIYYLIVLFTGGKDKQPNFFDFKWWLIAGFMGYIVNGFLVKKNNYAIMILGNLLILSALVIGNWGNMIFDGNWGIGISVSILIFAIYLRSATMIYKVPTLSLIHISE